ncbi:DinB family protein [Paenibacillus ehimensis]|uniref:DinB family protein n=1 Tax=Paenibacillus ehimensis TaxID=79264 RepID=UPI0004718A94|nr:DinB family protein [Paenibacillus ehimensis]
MEALIEEYGRGYKLLREAVEGLTEEELRFKPGPDKWSIHEILIHLADSELVSTQRLKKVLAEDEPLIMSWEQDVWAKSLGYEKLDREQHLLLFQLLRAHMQPMLIHLTAEQGDRVGVYEDGGRFTFRQMLEYRVKHVRIHLAQIERVKEEYCHSRV